MVKTLRKVQLLGIAGTGMASAVCLAYGYPGAATIFSFFNGGMVANFVLYDMINESFKAAEDQRRASMTLMLKIEQLETDLGMERHGKRVATRTDNGFSRNSGGIVVDMPRQDEG